MSFQGLDGYSQAELYRGSFASGYRYFLPIGETLFGKEGKSLVTSEVEAQNIIDTVKQKQ